MVLTELLDEIIELTIFSSYIKHEKPISLLLVASPEAGKTRTVIRYAKNQGVELFTDATASGILDALKEKFTMGMVKHIIFTDFITPLSKNVDTRHTFITFLNGLIEDGIINIQTRYNHFNIPLKKAVGMIACIAPVPLSDNRRHWKAIGFMSRVIPFSWSYSDDSIDTINESIQYEQYHSDEDVILDLPKRDVQGKLEPDYWKEIEIALEPELSGRLTGIAEILAERKVFNLETKQYEKITTAKSNNDNPYGFRLTKQLHTLAKSSALKDKREKVEPKDIDKIVDLSKYMNYNCVEF